MEITINGKMSELKFNFKALFKANSEYSSVENGVSQGNGAVLLFLRLIDNDVTVIPDIIKVAGNFGKATNEDKLFEAVDEITDGGEKIDEVLTELKDELKQSGFFMKTITSYKNKVEDNLTVMEAKAKTDETVSNNLPIIKAMLKSLNENL
ncbi:tail assembly chaperone [Weissella paramesenteroides]|uniref:tail assembly chaperone n=1 Tax=Weissella paramesenteroides TaxID=1249 RepID=UPI0014081E0A|nr:tail assembly chaperone [Weissella paramesenteroides]